jgi:hypothetical protein
MSIEGASMFWVSNLHALIARGKLHGFHWLGLSLSGDDHWPDAGHIMCEEEDNHPR